MASGLIWSYDLTDAGAAVRWHSVAHGLDIRLESGAEHDALGRDGRLEHRWHLR